MSPENQWLEDAFHVELVPFLGDVFVFFCVNSYLIFCVFSGSIWRGSLKGSLPNKNRPLANKEQICLNIGWIISCWYSAAGVHSIAQQNWDTLKNPQPNAPEGSRCKLNWLKRECSFLTCDDQTSCLVELCIIVIIIVVVLLFIIIIIIIIMIIM